MKRTLLIAAGLAAVTAMLLSGCSQPAPVAAPEPVSIRYLNFDANGANEEHLQTVAAAFEKKYPWISVDVTSLPLADYRKGFGTALAAGTTDVFDIEYGAFPAYQAAGHLAEIRASNTADYRKSLLDAYSVDGIQYALPSSFSPTVLFYNVDLFDAAKVAHPNAEWTWSQELAAGKKLTNRATGVWGDYQSVTFDEFYKAFAQNGGSFLADDGTAITINNQLGVDAAYWLIDKAGQVMPTAAQGQGSPGFGTRLFAEGKLGMLRAGVDAFDTFAALPFTWDIAVEPGSTNQASAVAVTGVAVAERSKNPQAATLWAEFLTSSEIAVTTRLDTGWGLPPLVDETALSGYLSRGSPANRQAVFDSLDGIVLPPIVPAGKADLRGVIDEELANARTGRKSIEDALESAERRINATLGG